MDDLEQKQLERVRPAAFLILRTSPKERGYQAWLAVQGGDREFTRRLKEGTGADLEASGSVRMAGTGNFKRAYTSNFPLVAIEEIHPGRIVTRSQIESMGLAAQAPAKHELPAAPLRCSVPPCRLAWPSYDRCMEESLARGRKRSSADFTFCYIAIDHFKRTPEETADKLMEVSTKAKKNDEDYAIGQAMRAAERGALNPRSQPGEPQKALYRLLMTITRHSAGKGKDGPESFFGNIASFDQTPLPPYSAQRRSTGQWTGSASCYIRLPSSRRFSTS